MNKTRLTCVQDLFDLAGSVQRIAMDFNLHQYTVERWRMAGVPEKYDKQLAIKYGATPFELRQISKKVRARRGK
jgi:hypothetical protein